MGADEESRVGFLEARSKESGTGCLPDASVFSPGSGAGVGVTGGADQVGATETLPADRAIATRFAATVERAYVSTAGARSGFVRSIMNKSGRTRKIDSSGDPLTTAFHWQRTPGSDLVN